jgi:hypothetical protein
MISSAIQRRTVLTETPANGRSCRRAENQQPNQTKIEARHYINELLAANQTLRSHPNIAAWIGNAGSFLSEFI